MSNLVSIKRENVTKTIPKRQWEAMVRSGNTYGWKLHSGKLADEVKAIEEKIKSDQEPKENTQVDFELLNLSLKNIKPRVSDLSIEESESLLAAEMNGQNRASVINLFEKHISTLKSK